MLVLDCSSGGNVSRALVNAAERGRPARGRLPEREHRGVQCAAPDDRELQRDGRRLLGRRDKPRRQHRRFRRADARARRTSQTFFNRAAGSSRLPATSTATTPADPYYQFIPIGIGGKSVTRAVPPDARGPGARVPGLGQRDRHQRRHQLLPDPQLLPGAGRRAARSRSPSATRAFRRRQRRCSRTARSAAARSSRSRASAGGRAAVEQEVRQPAQVPDPHPPAGRHPDPDRARVRQRQGDPRPQAPDIQKKRTTAKVNLRGLPRAPSRSGSWSSRPRATRCAARASTGPARRSASRSARRKL